MKINKNFLQVYSSLTQGYTEFDLNHFQKEAEKYMLDEARGNFIANTIKGILETNTVFNNRELAVDLFNSIGDEHYYLEIIPKISFGRRQGHTNGVAKFIRDNPSLNVLVITQSSCMVQHINSTISSYGNFDNYEVFSFSNQSSIVRLRNDVNVVLVDEQPHPNSTTRPAFHRLVQTAIGKGIPLIVLGTMY